MFSLNEAISKVAEKVGGTPLIYSEGTDEYVFCFGDPMFLESINKNTGEHKTIFLNGLLIASTVGGDLDMSEDDVSEAGSEYEKYSKLYEEMKPIP